MEQFLYRLRKLSPDWLLGLFRPPYHLALSYLGALIYRHPSKDIFVVAITGTKGKSTTVELMAAILRSAGLKTASLSTIRFQIDADTRPNLYKMTTPGRFFVQHFLRQAVEAGCTHAVLEMTSEAAKQYRHKFIEFDGVIFTNLTPEHIESHGSFEKYKKAKLEIVRALLTSIKRPRFAVANVDDEHGNDFLNIDVERRLPYSLNDLKLHTLHKDGAALIFKENDEEITIRLPLVGLFNIYNALAAISLGRALDISWKDIERALGTLDKIPGRVEHFVSAREAAKKVTAVVDYAHTPDSLQKLYGAFKDVQKVCVLGNTGGGRDRWKRPEMAAIAERHCDHVILTNEDPYDENPRKIVEEMAMAIEDKSKLEIIMDRQLAIRRALEIAPDNSYVLISGKGTDPYIMAAQGVKVPWSDAEVVKEELSKI